MKKKDAERVIYGVTDRSQIPFHEKINDFLINNSPVTSKERSLFFNSFRLLVRSGVPVIRAIRMLARRTTNPRFERILDTMEHDLVQRGSTLSGAMSKHPQIFPRSEIKMIYSGEISGKLEEVLDTVTQQIQKNIELERRVKSALMYPTVVMVMIAVAIVVIMIFVVPTFETMFSDFGEDLPTSTKILINSSQFLQHYWWFAGVVVAAIVLMFKNWKNSDNGSRVWDRWIHSLPGIGGIVRNINTVRLADNAGAMLASGLPLEKTLRVLHDILVSPCQRDAIVEIEQGIRHGKLLHEAFAEQEILDPVLAEMLEIGSKAGTISEVLLQIGEQYESEVNAQLKNLSQLIEPVVIVIVGLAVVFLALAIMTPVFKMQSLFAG